MIRRPPTSTLFPNTRLFRSAVDGPGSGLVPEPLEARAGQDGPAVAIVHEPELGVADQGIARDPLDDRLELAVDRSEEHTSELQSRQYLVCRLLLANKKKSQG